MAEGGADLCLTSVTHYLRARATWGRLPARFVAIVVQRSPLVAIVAEPSGIRRAKDLAGRRIGGPPDGRFTAEVQAALAARGLPPAEHVPLDYWDAQAALGRGDVDAVADFVDLVPRVRRLAGVPVRPVPLGIDAYSSGLVAADRLADDAVARIRAAVAAALEAQRADPSAGLDQLRRRYPDADPTEALEGWSLVEPNIFTGVEPGSMEPGRWSATLAWVSAAHGLPAPPPATVYRPQFAPVPTG